MENNLAAAPCALEAWQVHEAELRSWLKKTTKHQDLLPDDISQEVFLRLIAQQQSFCKVNNPRAWLFRVARNLIIDHQRKPQWQSIEGLDFSTPEEQVEQIDLLAERCLPRVLNELAEQDRDLLIACDLNGTKQAEYARQKGLTLVAVKARLRRARQRLMHQLATACKVQLDEQQQVCGFTPRD